MVSFWSAWSAGEETAALPCHGPFALPPFGDHAHGERVPWPKQSEEPVVICCTYCSSQIECVHGFIYCSRLGMEVASWNTSGIAALL